MVENSLKYDDLPTARVAGVVIPSPGGAYILENHPFMKIIRAGDPPPLLYTLSSVADLDCFAGSGLYGCTLRVPDRYASRQFLALALRLG